jgi:hypothetical protein
MCLALRRPVNAESARISVWRTILVRACCLLRVFVLSWCWCSFVASFMPAHSDFFSPRDARPSRTISRSAAISSGVRGAPMFEWYRGVECARSARRGNGEISV